jgi:hypothetical protein
VEAEATTVNHQIEGSRRSLKVHGCNPQTLWGSVNLVNLMNLFRTLTRRESSIDDTEGIGLSKQAFGETRKRFTKFTRFTQVRSHKSLPAVNLREPLNLSFQRTCASPRKTIVETGGGR